MSLTLFCLTSQIVFLTFSEIKPQETIRVSFLIRLISTLFI